MPVLGGASMNTNAYRTMPNGTSGVASHDASVPTIVDGTPVRVVVLALSAAAGLAALKMAGFKFNVGVSA